MEISRRVDNHIDPRIQPSPARTHRSRDVDAGDDGGRAERDGSHVGVSGDSVQISAQATARLDNAASADGSSTLEPATASAVATDLATALAAQPPAAFGAQANLSADAVLRLLG